MNTDVPKNWIGCKIAPMGVFRPCRQSTDSVALPMEYCRRLDLHDVLGACKTFHSNLNSPPTTNRRIFSPVRFDHQFVPVQTERRVGNPVFDAVIELYGGRGGEREGDREKGEGPRWTIVKDVGGIVDELLGTGAVYRPEIRMPLADLDDYDHDHDDGGGDGVFDEVRECRSGP